MATKLAQKSESKEASSVQQKEKQENKSQSNAFFSDHRKESSQFKSIQKGVQQSSKNSNVQVYQQISNQSGLQLQSEEELGAQQKLKENGTIQGRFATATNGATVAPKNRGQLSAWITANCSADVADLITNSNVLLAITWDDGMADFADTDINMAYTDGAGTAGNINLFGAAASAAALDGLTFPLNNYLINVTLRIQTGGVAHAGAPAAAGAISTWEATMVHELEAHTKICKKVYKNLAHMEARPTHADWKKKTIKTSLSTRDGDSEHQSVAAGGSSIKASHEKAILSADRAKQVDILIDAAYDRVDHMGYLTKDSDKKIAYRDLKTWYKRMTRMISDVTPAEKIRIDALLNLITNNLSLLP